MNRKANGIERRVVPVEGIERRQTEDQGGGRRLVGHASVFDAPYPIFDFREVVRPGAFRRAIEEGQDVRALRNHNADQLLGRTKSGTARLSEDERGLRVEVDLPETPAADELLAWVERGDLDQMSFAFTVAPGGERWSRAEDDVYLRELVDLDLFDVSFVTYPANPETDVALRSFERMLEERQSASVARVAAELQDRERRLRVPGISRLTD